MPSIALGAKLSLDRCPHCSINRPNLRKVHTEATNDFLGQDPRTWGVYVCDNCGGVVTAFAYNYGGEVRATFPRPRGVSEEIPDRPATFLSQAIESIHTPAGAVMLAASAVDAMLKSIGLTNGTLYARIDQAATDHLITAEMAAWAHDVRLDANDQRHADEGANLPGADDAIRCVEFALAIADILFVLPSRVRRGREAARKRTNK